jgi:hypothetical protein
VLKLCVSFYVARVGSAFVGGKPVAVYCNVVHRLAKGPLKGFYGLVHSVKSGIQYVKPGYICHGSNAKGPGYRYVLDAFPESKARIFVKLFAVVKAGQLAA